MNEREVKLRAQGHAKVYDVTNRHTETSLPVVAVGPRDALLSISGYQAAWVEGEWLVTRDWKVLKGGRK